MSLNTAFDIRDTTATVTSIVPAFVMEADATTLSDAQLTAAIRLLTQELQGRELAENGRAA
jgi:hypothetical protein